VTKNLHYVYFGALLLLLVGINVWSVQDTRSARRAERIVRRALVACKRVNYTGRKVTKFKVGKGLVESEALVARRAPGMRRIHYTSPAGLKGVTVWQDGQRTYRYAPKSHELEIYDRSRKKPVDADKEESLVLSNYQPRLEGEETIAGRTAYRIRLAPRHSGDAWKRLWVDRETFLQLGSEDYDGSDRLLRTTRFKEVSFDSLDPKQFQPTQYVMRLARRTYSDEELRKSVDQVSRAIGFSIRVPVFVPAGYHFDGAYTYPCKCGCEMPAAQVRWSNGLNTISMFQCGHPCGNGAACTVPTDPRANCVHKDVGNESFLFVGETDRANLKKMADSLVAPRRP
jgi:outer membrane lipoprotein-sorting protein